MNGHSREVIDYLREPLPDEEEWPCCDGGGLILDPYDILPPEICLVCGGFNGERKPLSNCCNAPPAYGQTPQETDYCSECGEHCEFENSEQED